MLADTHYARSGDVSIAYQVWGDGPVDLVLVPGIVSHVEFFHELPGYTDYLRRLARFARVLVFDKRGNGLSDRPGTVGTLEERIDDMRAVMDAVGSERAAIIGFSEGGPMSALFAATHPDRVTHLVLCGTFACYVGDDEGAVVVPELFSRFVDWVADQWGEGGLVRLLTPSLIGDPSGEAWFPRIERQTSSPGTIRALWEAVGAIDVRPVLPTIRVPTLVVRRDHEIMPDYASAYMAEQIPGAQLATVPGVDHVPWSGDSEPYAAAIEEFVTGHTPEIEPDDRVLATVLFTDVVGSTERAASLGDRRWGELLDRFRAAVRDEVARHRGTEVNTRGDDFLITFDGPARAIRCARAIAAAARGIGLEVRCGVHTGEVEVRGEDIAGLAVHIGARVSALAGAGEILATTTVRDLVVGSGLTFAERGQHELKGVPGAWGLVAVGA